MSKPEYNFTELVADVANDTEQDQTFIAELLARAFHHMAANVADRGRIEIKYFGVLSLEYRQERAGTLFGDKTRTWKTTDRYEIEFNPDPIFLDTANEFKSADFPQLPITR